MNSACYSLYKWALLDIVRCIMFKLGVQATEEFIRQIEFSRTNADVDTGTICDIV